MGGSVATYRICDTNNFWYSSRETRELVDILMAAGQGGSWVGTYIKGVLLLVRGELVIGTNVVPST